MPSVSGRRLAAALARIGYRVDHQTGGHLILRNTKAPFRRLTIPMHREVSRGTLRAIIRQAGLTVEEMLSLLG